MQQDEYGIYSIYPFIHTPFWQTIYFKVLISLIIGCVFVGVFYFFFKKYSAYRAKKMIPIKVVVLQRLEKLKSKEYQVYVAFFYADLGFVLRLFLTDTHGVDMLCFTEKELSAHIGDCKKCVNYGLVDLRWQKEIHSLLDRMSDIKYQEKNLSLTAAVEDLETIMALISAIYSKKAV